MSKSDPPLAYIFLKGSIQEQAMKIRLDKSTTGPFFYLYHQERFLMSIKNNLECYRAEHGSAVVHNRLLIVDGF